MGMNLKKIIALFIIELIVFIPIAMAEFSISVGSKVADPVTKDSATLTFWTTPGSAAQVNYSTDQSSLSISIVNDTISNAHKFLISELTPLTTYYFEIYAKNITDGTLQRFPKTFSFRTASTGDITPPNITAVNISLPEDTGVIYMWDTTEASNSMVYFGQTTDLMEFLKSSELATKHSMSANVTKGKKYYYIVSSCDSAGNCVNSTRRTFIAAKDEDVFLNATVPRYSKLRTIDITGSTTVNALVKVYVNGEWVRGYTTKQDGKISIENVYLMKLAPAVNTVTLEVTSQNDKTVSESYHVTVDNVPPTLHVQEVPRFVNTSTVVINGTVSENVTLLIGVNSEAANLAPQKIDDLNMTSVDTNMVELRWTMLNETDIKAYLIYKDDVLITATSENIFIDTGATVDSGKSYVYRVAAIDTKCQIGTKSDPLTITTRDGGMKYNANLTELKYECTPLENSNAKFVTSNFSEPVNLAEGTNYVKITATDAAGNIATEEFDVIVDTMPPSITEHNLDKLNPSYTEQVVIKGKASEESEIWIWVNDVENPTPTTKVTTESDGSFEAKVTLSRYITKTTTTSAQNPDTQTTQTYETGQQWDNQIKMIAVDTTGGRSDAVTGKISYAVCGQGSWWKVDIQGPMPSMLNPRMIIEGMAEVGFAVNLTWAGGGTPGVMRTNPSVTVQPLSELDKEKWDEEYVTFAPAWHTNKMTGYVSLKINPMVPGSGTNMTMTKREQNISQHRLGECGNPAVGCVKVPLMITMTFDANSSTNTQSYVQKQCWDIMVEIDRTVPPSVIPQNLLKALIQFLDVGIKLIDSLLKILKPIKVYTFYACIATFAADFIMAIKETWSCQTSNGVLGLANLMAKEASSPNKNGKQYSTKEMLTQINNVATVGKCEEVYGSKSGGTATSGSTPASTGTTPSGGTTAAGTTTAASISQDQKYEACKSCEDAKRERLKLQRVMKWVCDRMFCRQAPTLRKYIKDAKMSSFTVNTKTYFVGSSCGLYGEAYKKSILDKKENKDAVAKAVKDNLQTNVETEVALAKVNDPTLNDPKNKAKLTALTKKIQDDMTKKLTTEAQTGILKTELGNSGLTYIDGLEYKTFKEIFLNYKAQESAAASQKASGTENKEGATTSTGVNCNDLLHPADPKCCGTEYMEEWDSSCMLMDEMKESMCLEGQNYGQFDSLRDELKLSCNFVWNSVAGFCDPRGNPVEDIVGTKYQVKPDCAGYSTPAALNQDKNVVSRNIYFRLIPVTGSASTDTTPLGYAVDLVYLKKDFKLEKGAKIEVGKASAAKSGTSYEPIDPKCRDKTDGNLAYIFTRPKNDAEKKQNIDKLKKALEKATSTKVSTNDATDYYNRVMEKLGVTDKEYLFDPTQFFYSFQCVCLPAISSWLGLIQKAMTEIRMCFEKILLTGDGKAGTCRAVLSVYVCDLLFALVKCFAEKYSKTGTSDSMGGSIGNIFGTLTKATSSVEKSVADRYGKTGLWAALAEKKVMHAACLWAFTGTWDIDIGGMLEQDVGVAIKSVAFLYPCERRFVSFGYSTNPPGQTRWNYHFGVGLIAGSDLQYKLRLKCRQGPQCSSTDGFEDGMCDCRSGEQLFIIDSGSLKKLETLGEKGELWKTLEFQKYRYDYAELLVDYKGNDGKTVKDEVIAQCSIGEMGGKPPAFCKYSLADGAFLCQLFLGSSAFARFNSDPTPVYRADNKAFGTGDMITFQYDIQQKITDPECNSQCQCADTKILIGTIKNQNGGTVCSNYEGGQGGICLHQDGQITGTLDMCVLTDAAFTNQQGTGTAVFAAKPGFASTTTIETDSNYFTVLGTAASDVEFYVRYQGGDGACQLGTTVNGNDVSGTTSGCTNNAAGATATYGGITLQQKKALPTGAIKPGALSNYIVKVTYKRSTATATLEVGKTYTWTGEFTINDAFKTTTSEYKIGQPTTSNGQTQKKTVSFNVIYAQGGTAATKACTGTSLYQYLQRTQDCKCGTSVCSAGQFCDGSSCQPVSECSSSYSGTLEQSCWYGQSRHTICLKGEVWNGNSCSHKSACTNKVAINANSQCRCGNEIRSTGICCDGKYDYGTTCSASVTGLPTCTLNSAATADCNCDGLKCGKGMFCCTFTDFAGSNNACVASCGSAPVASNTATNTNTASGGSSGTTTCSQNAIINADYCTCNNEYCVKGQYCCNSDGILGCNDEQCSS